MSTTPTISRFPSDVYADRLARAARATQAAGLDGLVITPGPDLQYLLGATASSLERLTALVVPADGSDAVVIVPRLELASLGPSAVAELGMPVRDWTDGDDPYRLVAAAVGVGSGRIAVADAMPALHVIPLADRFGRMPILATAVLRELRMVKDPAEVAALRRAGDAIDRVHARMAELLQVGRTERDVAALIAAAIVAEGHEAADFVIVGSGPNGADPHHEVSDRVVEAGDIVVIDIGGAVTPGYYSDSTRTYAMGDPAPDIADTIAVLERAQQAARDAVRPGVTAAAVDAAARDVLVAAGLGDAFVHRTGHGIGLSVHEEPYVVAGNDTPLVPGMAFSIEPGVYFPGRWGARIEDIVVVTDDGADALNRRPRGLTVLG
ncbi:aminopeptidase P family protein [Microbacterium sp. Sa4CUA7]|uniref:Aminopeptidase P family protein n=1 Tax=Microbacterium pullorum TaxID=2762236 RepID=A0ABR8S1X2_9MICO|nr:Xaa-Pro peptidase family protein [Microbacterium pullorum]MBD7957474.1 aminopeptidase P family protein [Microbacterium pullorum]